MLNPIFCIGIVRKLIGIFREAEGRVLGVSTELTCRLRSVNPAITNALDNFNKVQHLSFIRLRAVPEGDELMKGGVCRQHRKK